MSPEDALRYNEWHNLNGENLTLGKYFADSNGNPTPDAYISKAQSTGDMYFDLGQEWNEIKTQYSLTDNQMFDIFNKPALDDAVSSGKGIRFSQNPENYNGSALWDEWVYLQNEHGFKRLVREGEYWYAVK